MSFTLHLGRRIIVSPKGIIMAGPFFDRLKKYFTKVGEVLKGQAGVASIFPNATDIGTSRERFETTSASKLYRLLWRLPF